MNIKILQVGELNSNCYIAVTAPGQCVAVDIGGSPRLVIEYLKMNNLKLTKILLTHGHFDHIGGAEKVRLETGAEVYVHELDAPMLDSSARSLHSAISIMPFKGVTEYNTVKDGDIIEDGNVTFRVLHTPGHSPGRVCYIAEDEHMIFSGDTLFCCSIGRTDFPGSSGADMVDSLRKLAAIEGEYKVYPGHNEYTDLGYEKKNNPYMSRF